MQRVRVAATTPWRTASEALVRLGDLASYPQHTADVHYVRVACRDGRPISEWEVAFGGGTLRWVEEDEFDLDNGRLDFRLVEGDIAAFAGSWTVEPLGAGCRVSFDAEFDLDIPGLADVLEPVAVAALTDSVSSILMGLLGEGATVGLTPGQSRPELVLR